jgi:hypothetical protein
LHNEHALLSVRSYPPITQPLLAGQFATEMTQLSIWGQTALMIERLESRRQYLASLTATANLHRQELKRLRKNLQAELDKLQTAAELYEKAKRDSEAEKGRVNVLQESIARLRARPEINRIDQAKPPKLGKLPRNRMATPLSTPVAGNRAATPASMPAGSFTSSGTSHARQSLVANYGTADSSSDDEDSTSGRKPASDQASTDSDSEVSDSDEAKTQKGKVGGGAGPTTTDSDNGNKDDDAPPANFGALNAEMSET